MSADALRQMYGAARRRVSLTWRRLFCALSRPQIDAALEEVMQSAPKVLMVHSSLSACGFVGGGPHDLIASLMRQCDTLCLPTHTYCYSGETFDPRKTKSVNGLITNVFWRMEGVQRSVHPTHSLAARGPAAEALCRGHLACNTACGPDTPYQKLIGCDAAVLMFGATMNTYTLFHCAEHAAGCSYLYEPQRYPLSFTDHDGNVHSLSIRRQDMTVPRRFTEMRGELVSQGLLRCARLGLSELLFVPSSQHVHDYLLQKLGENELHLVAQSYRSHMTQPHSIS